MVEQMADKELEEQLIEAGEKLFRLPSDVDELLSLLDQIESCLSKVEQSPSKSMQNALSPSMKALVANDLLRHTDTNVKVSVASCVSEITRITAPDAPYSDDEMKQIFQLIVGSFELLFDTSSRSYSKRVSILETVAKVRSCVVMLDLECDDMILEMFRHFLKTIQDYHPANVYSSMETIMSLVLEESEEITPELLYPLLTTVKKGNQDVLPIARKLGEGVLQSCTSKLKPYLLNAVKSTATSPDDYSDIVASICQEASNTKERNNDPVSKEHLDDERNSHKKMGPDLSTQVTQELNLDAAACPGKVDVLSEKSKQFTASNGDAQNLNDDSVVSIASPKKAESSQPVPQAALGEPDGFDNELAKEEDKTDKPSQNNRSQSPNVSPDSDEEITGSLSQKKSHNKKDDKSLSEDQPTDKTVSPPGPGKESTEEDPLPTTSRDEPLKVASASPSLSLSDRGNSKRGRPARMKKGSAKEDDNSISEGQSIDKPVSSSGPEKEAVEEAPLPTAALLNEPVKVAEKIRSKRGRPAKAKKEITKDDDNSLSEDKSTDKPISPSEREKDVVDVPLLTTSQEEAVKVASPSPTQSLADRGHSKRGRPSARPKKVSTNEDDNSLSEDQSINNPVSSPSGAKNEAVEEVPLPTTSQDDPVKAVSPSPSQSHADKSRSKRGRPARSKKGKTNKDKDHSSPSVPKGTPFIEQVESDDPPEVEEKPNRSLSKKGLVDMESEEEKVSDASSGDDSEEKANKPGKKGQFEKAKEEEKDSEATSDSEEKPLKRKKVEMKSRNSDASSAKKQVQKTKKGKNSSTTQKELPGKSSNKKTTPTSKSTEKSTSKNQKLPEETPRTTSKRKRTPAKEEISGRSSGEDIGKNLVGSKIKVWWPDDEMFYEGTVESFDPVAKKHKVAYIDGDVEVLILKEECWEHIDEFSVPDVGQATDVSSPNASSEMPQKKKAKTGSGSASKHAKIDTSSKKGKQSSTSKSKDEATSSHGKSKNAKSLEDTPKAVSSSKSSKSKGNTPKTGSKATDDTPKTVSKAKVDTPNSVPKSKEAGSKSKDATPASKSKESLKLGSKSKEETPKTEMKSEDDTANTKTKSKPLIFKTGGKSGANESSAKGKPDTSKVQESETKSGKKRKK